jgi:hypothetical protein
MAAVAALALGIGVLPAAAGPATGGQVPGERTGAAAEGHGPQTPAPGAAEAEDPPMSAAAATNLSYSTVDPCRTFDSRQAGGPFGRGEGFYLNLLDPCGLPSDGSVKAVMANVISVDAVGTGYVRAAAFDPTGTGPSATVLNFNNRLVSSNAIPLPVCDIATSTCEWDVDLWIPSASTSNIVLDIVGYFS